MKHFHPWLSRRDWLRLSAAGLSWSSASGWFGALAADAAAQPQRRRACILLWMEGGPSQIDTFDPKPGQPIGGPYKAIDTAAGGVRVGEHPPGVAKQMQHLAVVRSMSTKEGDHGRAAYLLRTGNLPQEPIQYPTLGSLLSKELGDPEAALPSFVSIGSRRGLSDGGYGAGYLGPEFAPLLVGSTDNDPYTPVLGEMALAVPDLKPAAGVRDEQVRVRADLLREMNAEFAAGREGQAARQRRNRPQGRPPSPRRRQPARRGGRQLGLAGPRGRLVPLLRRQHAPVSIQHPPQARRCPHLALRRRGSRAGRLTRRRSFLFGDFP
jgi:hypothetical protein